MVRAIPKLRVRAVNPAALNPAGTHVLHWMIAHRRTRHNFALQHALFHAERLQKPLVVLEPLRVGYRWASDRMHRFVLEGMAVNARRFAKAGVTYLPYVEDHPGAGSGLLAALAQDACLVTTDDYPCFFLPRMIASAGRQLPVRLEAVDANGVIPLQATDHAFPTAHSFRRWFQRNAAEQLSPGGRPLVNPLARWTARRPSAALKRTLREVRERWPMAAKLDDEASLDALIASLPIDHEVGPGALRGGSETGERRLEAFIADDLARYADGRNHPDHDASSGLSPWLHFGQVGAHQVLHAVLRAEDWSPALLGDAKALRGSRRGWWGLSESAEGFLDELVIWRELGQVFCWHHPEAYQRYGSLPEWARTTLENHREDDRPSPYTLAQLDGAQTHDEIWNAAQRQLVQEGRMHNYLRMLWGKKILEWSADAEQAIERMIHLNDKYALDGRDPNSYSGIFWVCGRFDRAWGPERPIFGKIRYMSSDSTRRKLKMSQYLARWGASPELF